MELLNQTVLITGGAGRIGSAIASKILEDGGTVLLTDINKEKLIYLKDRIFCKKKEKVHIFVADITTSNGIEKLLKECLNKVKRS